MYELCEQGYEVVMTAHGGLIRRPDGIPVRLIISPAGVWHVDIRQLFSDLPHVVAGADAHAAGPTHPPDKPHDSISSANMPLTCALGHARPDCDDLELLHRRTGHTSHNILREAVRNGLVTGVQLDRKHFGTRSKINRVLCDTCAKAKISRTSFPRSRERLADLGPGSRVGADILITLNTPSREGYKYVLILVDYASKYVWIYPLVSRDEASVLKCLTTSVQSDFPPFGFKLGHLHSDGGAELVSTKVLAFLHAHEIATSHTPRDTPEMNSIVERKVKDLKQRALCMLLYSTMPVLFWWLSVRASCFILNRVPTPTMAGYLTPYECLRHTAPSLKWLRIWVPGLCTEASSRDEEGLRRASVCRDSGWIWGGEDWL